MFRLTFNLLERYVIKILKMGSMGSILNVQSHVLPTCKILELICMVLFDMVNM